MLCKFKISKSNVYNEQRRTSFTYWKYKLVRSVFQKMIASKDESFFQNEIRKLPERWEKIVVSDGQYFN
ncbi:hypothetical protein ALC62_08040 [Cyphomyrmex costatus]|uniref:Uncharacterized protein n=1 Tax=Cyphomyrmex costatus TaxID=456900 RepID=A0A195CL61_9HYME|nr:hypothetical protein ALC62_08040 [Cyphomyrmex costatus]